jgi:hypothetical protein
MKAKLVKADLSEVILADDPTLAGTPGKIIARQGVGKTTLARPMSMLPAPASAGGVGALAPTPQTNTMMLTFTFVCDVGFADETAAEIFRLTFPAQIPPENVSLVLSPGGSSSDATYESAKVQNVSVEQKGTECIVSYQLRAEVSESVEEG